MIFRRGLLSGRMLSLVFLSFAFILAIFSLFYADWYSSENISGLTGEEPPDCYDPDGVGCPLPTPPADTPSGGDSSPSQQDLDSSKTAAKGSVDATEGVLEIIEDYVSVYSASSNGEIPSVSGDESSTSEGDIVSAPVTSTSSNICFSLKTSIQCRDELQNVKLLISQTMDGILVDYENVLNLEKKYSSNNQIQNDKIIIEENLDTLQNNLNVVEEQLISTVERMQDRQQNIAGDIVAHEERVTGAIDYLGIYTDKYGSMKPHVPSKPTLGLNSVSNSCSLVLDLIIFTDNVDVGKMGVDSNGEKCVIDTPKPKPVPASGGSSSSGLGVAGTVSGAVSPPSFSNAGGGNNIQLYFEEPSSLENGGHVDAFVAALSPANNFVLGFFSASNTLDLNEEISNFVNTVVSGLSGDALSGHVVPGSVYEGSSTRVFPWFLWMAIAVLIVPFLFFSRFMLPTHERLVYSGRKALLRGEFDSAVEIYKELLSKYKELNDESGKDVRQEILAYFILLKSGLHAAGISYDVEFYGNRLPYFVLSRSQISGIASNYYRVEKILQDSLRDLRKFPAQIVARLPVIANMYSQLDKKDKEKLAPLYERFVYEIRSVKS